MMRPPILEGDGGKMRIGSELSDNEVLVSLKKKRLWYWLY